MELNEQDWASWAYLYNSCIWERIPLYITVLMKSKYCHPCFLINIQKTIYVFFLKKKTFHFYRGTRYARNIGHKLWGPGMPGTMITSDQKLLCILSVVNSILNQTWLDEPTWIRLQPLKSNLYYVFFHFFAHSKNETYKIAATSVLEWPLQFQGFNRLSWRLLGAYKII